MKKYNFYKLNYPTNNTLLICFYLSSISNYCGIDIDCDNCAIESWCDLGSNGMEGCEIVAQTDFTKYLILIKEDEL